MSVEVQEKAEDVRAETEVPRPGMSESDLESTWLYGKSAHTRLAYRGIIDAFQESLDVPLLSVKTKHVTAFLEAEEARGLKLSSVNQRIGTLKSFYDFAARSGAIDRSPCWMLRHHRLKDDLGEKLLSIEEVRRILAVLKPEPMPPQTGSKCMVPTLAEAARIVGHDVETLRRWKKFNSWTAGRSAPYDVEAIHHWLHSRAVERENLARFRNWMCVRVIFLLGLRVSEAVGLRWADVRVNDGKVYATVFGKGSVTRTLVLREEVWRDLRGLRNGDRPADPIFRSRVGTRKPITTRHVRRFVERAAEEAGIEKHVTVHMLRHAYATAVLSSGCPIHVVKQTLGHRSLISTERYLHAVPTDTSVAFLPEGI